MNARGQSRPANRGIGWAPPGAAALLLCIGIAGPACSHKDPNKPLTQEEGQALVESVQKHPPKPDDLTPAEKSYLSNHLATHK